MGPARPDGFYGILPLGVIANGEISAGSKVYLAFLFAVSFAHEGVSWYSQIKAAEIMKVSRWSIARYADELAKHGLIEMKDRKGIRYTRICLEMFVQQIPNLYINPTCSKSAQGDVANLQQGLLQICHTNESKEGEKVNDTNSADRLRGVGQNERPDPSSLEKIADKASALSRAAKDKLFKKKMDRLKAVDTSALLNVDRWKGTRFYDYLRHLCTKHSVPLGDLVDLTESTPPRYAKAMNDVIALCDKRAVTKQELAYMLERLTAEWATASGGFTRDGKLSVYTLRNNIDRLIKMFKPQTKAEEKAQEEEVSKIKGISLDQFLDTPKQPKKEEGA